MKRTGKCVRREAQMSVRGKVQGERGEGGGGGRARGKEFEMRNDIK